MKRAILLSAVGLAMVALSACMATQGGNAGAGSVEQPADVGGGGY